MNAKAIAAACFILSGCALAPNADRGGVSPDDSSGFVVLSEEVSDVLIDARYYGTYNFIGNRMPGYEEPVVLLTREAAEALKKVSAAVVPRGYRLKVFDGYRPQKTISAVRPIRPFGRARKSDLSGRSRGSNTRTVRRSGA